MEETTYDIQELVKQSGVPRRTIYFYVQQGLLPPPEGAGLAAFYTGEHLLRLQLIPILRQQGLRLDDIRKKFSEMTPEAMRQIAASAPPAPAPVMRMPPVAILDEAAPEKRAAAAAQKFLHYVLPGGVTLIAPANLPALEQGRLERLLQAAVQIYTDPSGYDAAALMGESDTKPGENHEER